MSRREAEALLTALARREPIEAPVALVAAHPDDETVGAGASLHLFRRLLLVHVTDGAPRDRRDAEAAGFETCEAYAAARQRELRGALEAGGVHPVAPMACGLPIADQSAAHRLAWLAGELRGLLRGQGIAAVLTHAYEGGHPDHDAVAFAVRASGLPTVEMAGYHAAPDGGIEVGRFLPNGGPEAVVRLDATDRARREAMLASFTTQRVTLAPFFGMAEERFRPAPAYDFTRPPADRIYYDGFDWGMDSRRWCILAAEALAC